MDTPEENNPDPLGHLPSELRERLGREIAIDSAAVAQCDLDSRGRYADGYLVLADGRLGYFVRADDGLWRGDWLNTGNLTGAVIVEGLGINLLRLLTDGKAVAEYRFTLRHAREVAKLHRRLERRLGIETEEPHPLKERPHKAEKKLRCEKCGRVIPPWSEMCPACMSRRKVLSRLMDFVKPYKVMAWFGFSMAVLVTVTALVRPYLAKPMFNKGLGLAKGQEPNFDLLLTCILIMVGLMIITAVGNAVRRRFMATLGSRIARDVRNQAYTHLHKLSLSFFSRKPTGSLVTRITSDSDRIWDFVAFTVVEFIIAILTIVGVGVALFLLNWKLACFVLIPIPLMLFLMATFHKRMHRFFRRIHHRWSQMTAVVADALPGARVIKAFSQEKREIQKFSNSNKRVYDGEIEMITLFTLFGPVLMLCSQVGTILVWVIGGYWTYKGWMEPGTLVAYIGYMWMFYAPIHMLSHMDRMLNRAATSVSRIFEILDTEPTIFSKTGAETVENVRGQIELRDVSFSYDGVRKVLKNINLKIGAGEMIGLAGPSGGGKTTMINLICRFYDVLEGQILIDGVDIRDYELQALRKRIGVVLQEPFLFHGTVAENIAYGLPEASPDEIIEAARAANAHEFIVGFPDGYDTMVGERGQTLSGGERQRISIARAILDNPSILILDEATSSVDTETEKLIQEALDRLVADRTTIAIAHRLSTLRKAHRLVVLDKGEIIEQGTHEELAGKEGGLYAKLLHTQTELQSVMAVGKSS